MKTKELSFVFSNGVEVTVRDFGDPEIVLSTPGGGMEVLKVAPKFSDLQIFLAKEALALHGENAMRELAKIYSTEGAEALYKKVS